MHSLLVTAAICAGKCWWWKSERFRCA